MTTIRKNFSIGVMDKDTDERLLPDGVLRHAENVNILSSENSNEGSVKNMLSNKKLTNLYFGPNAIGIGKFEDTAKLKLYWIVVSDIGCWVVEYDQRSQSAVKVLSDTRPVGVRVLDFKKDSLITGIAKVITNNDDEDLLLLTDGNIEVLCFNIERAKSFSENGFEKEDVYLIKKPPLNAPYIQPLSLPIKSNDMEDQFFSFCYRYQYLDGEYSALSPLTSYSFYPKKFNPDFFELLNKGMVNKYNGVRITFDTGGKQVSKIQVCFKKSNSNNIYLIETFTKKNEGWGDYSAQSVVFMNNKLYKALPPKELYRLYDNIPHRAKALDLINNRVVLGNYAEGYNMIDYNRNEVVMDYTVGFESSVIGESQDLNCSINGSYFTFIGSGLNFTSGKTLIIEMDIWIEGISVFRDSFEIILPEDYNNLNDFLESADFQNFVDYINIQYQTNYNSSGEWDVSSDYDLETETSIQFSIVGGIPRFTVTPVIFKDTAHGDATVSFQPTFEEMSEEGEVISPVTLSDGSNSSSCKSNQSYSVGLVYRDEWGRASTVQTCDKNTVFIPQEFSANKNILKLTINHTPPAWATNYKVAVKTNPLVYHVLYVNEFYNEKLHTWVKLESSNKDKVKVGDFLNVKIAGGTVVQTPVKVKVLDIQQKEKNFVLDNDNPDTEEEIIEDGGLYMKIRPSGFSMDRGDFEVYVDSDYAEAQTYYPQINLNLFSNSGEPLPLEVGTYIKLSIKNWLIFKKSGRYELNYEREFYVQSDYDSIEDWVEDNLTGVSILNFKETKDGNPIGYVNMVGKVSIDTDGEGNQKLKVESHYLGKKNSRYARIQGEITIRKNSGIYVFETDPVQVENEVYFETAETYPIVDHNHIGKIKGFEKNQDQDHLNNVPAILSLSFFNCYSQGNGVESFRVYDDFNTNYLTIDTRPNLVSTEPYREIHRYADLTYGEPYVESSNINGLNEFNASTANWKELNKQDGEIQLIKSREGNLLVAQTQKWGYVLYGKDLLFNADGTTNLSGIPEVLGQYVPYSGLWGLSNPESFAVEGSRCYGVDKERGAVLRLSMDGITPIVKGMKDWFRDVLFTHSNAKIIGGFDPFNKRYQITIGEEPERLVELKCGNVIAKYQQTDSFRYILKLNDLSGDVVLNYNISAGIAVVNATFDGQTYTSGEVSGVGNLSFVRSNLTQNEVEVEIIPVSGSVDYEITNNCPTGETLRIVSIVLNDEDDLGKTMRNRYKWGNSIYYNNDDLFDSVPCSRWQEDVGVEGQGKFPLQGSVVRLQAVKDFSTSGEFNPSKCNKLYYLISENQYSESEIDEILDQASSLSISSFDEDGSGYEISEGSFLFNRNNSNEILYIIWDYRDGNPTLMDDYANCNIGQSVTVNVLANDDVNIDAEVSIITPPQYGTYVVNVNQTITYTHDGSNNFNDYLEYEVNQDGCKSKAKVYFSIGVPCGSSLVTSGNRGIYKAILSLGTGTGICGVKFNPASIPDRCQLYYNGVLVADSLFCGAITAIPVLPGAYSYPVFEYDGTNFQATGNNETISISSGDIDTVDTPNQARDVVFNKTTETPTVIELVVTGHPTNAGTAWTISEIICPTEE